MIKGICGKRENMAGLINCSQIFRTKGSNFFYFFLAFLFHIITLFRKSLLMFVSSLFGVQVTLSIFSLAVGNLRHLIVEACIARNIIDTSAYFWPGYVNACSNQIPSSISNQVDGWSSLMKGSKLTPGLVDVLAATPASR